MNNIKEKLLLQTQLENCSLIERRKESGRVLNLSQDPEDLHLCYKYQDHNSLTRRKTTVGSGRDWIRDYYLLGLFQERAMEREVNSPPKM